MNAIIEGDFKGNFYNACGCNDTGLQTDLVLNEISNLIVNKPHMVIATLYDSGYKFLGTTRRQLAWAVAEAIDKSPGFAAKMGTLIAIDNGLIAYDEVKSYAFDDSGYHNIQGGHYHNGSGAAAGGDAMFGMIGDIVSAVGNITQGGLMFGAASKGAEAAKATAQSSLEQTKIASEANLKAQKEQTRQEMLKVLGAKAGGSDINWAAIGVVVVLLLIAGGVGFWLIRRSAAGDASIPQKADGGNISAPVAAAEPTQNHQIAAVAANMGLGGGAQVQPAQAVPVVQPPAPAQQIAAVATPVTT